MTHLLDSAEQRSSVSSNISTAHFMYPTLNHCGQGGVTISLSQKARYRKLPLKENPEHC
jgi:hypothetical protein